MLVACPSWAVYVPCVSIYLCWRLVSTPHTMQRQAKAFGCDVIGRKALSVEKAWRLAKSRILIRLPLSTLHSCVIIRDPLLLLSLLRQLRVRFGCRNFQCFDNVILQRRIKPCQEAVPTDTGASPGL